MGEYRRERERMSAVRGMWSWSEEGREEMRLERGRGESEEY